MKKNVILMSNIINDKIYTKQSGNTFLIKNITWIYIYIYIYIYIFSYKKSNMKNHLSLSSERAFLN